MKKNNKTINYLSILLTSFVGGLFVLTGISKLFDIKEFSNSISLTIPFLSNISYLVAIIVIFYELLFGYLLLRRKYINVASILLAILSLIFIGYLSIQIITGSNTNCNCYGILGIKVTAFTQIVTDILILNSCVVMYILNSLKKTKNHFKHNIISWVISISFFLFMQYSIIDFVFSISTRVIPVIDLQIENIKIKTLANSNNKKVIFYVKFDDFSCPLCYDDFTMLSDYLNENKIKNLDVLYLFAGNNNHLFKNDSKRLDLWAKANAISYPISFADSLLQKQMKETKSSVYLFSENNFLQFKGTFPIGNENRKFIIEYLNKQ